MTTPSSNAASLHAFVHGRVQGVGFRAWVAQRAIVLGLTGFVRSLSDGRSVEVQAEGPRAALETMHAALRSGPSGSWVEKLDTTWGDATGAYSDFGVRT